MKKTKERSSYMEKRNYNVDLFRIIAAFLVTVLHVLGKGGILKSTSPTETNYWIAWFLEICAYCAVNCFALISGYLMVNKTVKVKNIIGLWFQVLFYSLLFTSLFFAFLPESRSIKNLVVAVMPILGKQWWYVSSYFALCFFIPFLNKAINNISQQTYKKILLLILFVICCIDCVLPIDAFTLNNGYSAIWLMIVYLFGAYIRKYNICEKITAFKCIVGFFAMIVLTFVSKITIWFFTKRVFGQAKFEDTFISYISITILLSAIFLFLFCLKIKINNLASKVIYFVSPAALGVYLIHTHPLVFNFLINNAFVSFATKSPIAMIICVILASLAIFVLCTIIELLRIEIFKLIKVSKLSEFIARKTNDFYLKVFEMKLK